ncbi:N-acetylmuramoyl-L-alanine amidase [Paenibacillus sp. UNCCL117]|uniref:spore cortex-lytic enzyme n=1 Tax=unclassified Paenibacillus TaxID=185978 RepID=UPI000885B6F9|nr:MULTISPECIES: spore cortex-lytic enzyme [unclassified Paenibacillus]SDC88255.1 N-acetylmuramoyl-L-alanine amidase [Paenibacillus sp. cl123]SFW28260.1 N-acetylmuramoyl-L-alanine amidase [Paenibacillus sp. UNCCL117]
MNKRLIVITVTLVAVLFAGLELKHRLVTEQTFSKNEIRYGASGTADTYELQGRLKFLGFYKGDVDGDFGYQTLKALKWFQSEFGLKADGVAGDKTKLKLWEATKNWKAKAEELPPWVTGSSSGSAGNAAGGGGAAASPPAGMTQATRLGFSQQDLKLMANAVHGEARGEPYIGQVAVAAVILNRVKSSSFPNTVSGVIFQPGAFTAVADGQIWLEPNETSFKAVQDAVNGSDPTGGCLYYFNPVTATSKWIWTRPQVKTIGKHIFCK